MDWRIDYDDDVFWVFDWQEHCKVATLDDKEEDDDDDNEDGDDDGDRCWLVS